MDKIIKIRSATEDEIWKISLASSSVSCNLDSIPTPFIKICVGEPKIINYSLSICTLLDSTGPEVLKNYRPVSYL